MRKHIFTKHRCEKNGEEIAKKVRLPGEHKKTSVHLVVSTSGALRKPQIGLPVYSNMPSNSGALKWFEGVIRIESCLKGISKSRLIIHADQNYMHLMCNPLSNHIFSGVFRIWGQEITMNHSDQLDQYRGDAITLYSLPSDTASVQRIYQDIPQQAF